MPENEPLKRSEKLLHELRSMWVCIIVEEEHVGLPQLEPLATECGFHLVKNLAIVYRIHCDTGGNVKAGLHWYGNTNAACEKDAYVHVGKFVNCSAFAEAAN